jgi:hypothetical protein
MPYTVTRQLQWPEGKQVVEISSGGLDYTNPDALVGKYPGEFETYDDPREAVQAAIAICRAWRKDGGKGARIAHGATGGMTMPFDPCTFPAAITWAMKRYECLPKCARCGGILSERSIYVLEDFGDEKFCSANCADSALAEFSATWPPDTGD